MRNLLRVWAFVGTQFVVSAPAIAQGPNTLWTRTYHGTGYDYGWSVQECAGGGFIIAGGTRSFVTIYYDVYLIRTDADGDTLWTKTYGGTGSDEGYSVQECVNGDFIIAGETESFGAGSYDVYLIRTNSDGDTLWTKTYGGTDYDEGYSVQECADSGFIITGATGSFGAGSKDVYLIRTNANGDTLWTKTYGGTSYDEGYSVQECASGDFIIAGVTGSFGAGHTDVYLIRTDADGNTLWTRIYGGTFSDVGKSVQECAAGGFIIAGYTYSFGAVVSDAYLIRTNANGDTLWTKTYGRERNYDYGYSVQECAAGGFIIAGTYSSSDDVWLIRISDATGVEERNERLEIGDERLQIYPNPSFGNAVIIRFQIPDVRYRNPDIRQGTSNISLKLYDISGRLVKTLYSGVQEKGYHTINVGAYYNTPTGIYFVRVDAGNYKATKKLTILR